MTLPAICVVSELPPPPGGMAVQAQELIDGLRREGHRVESARTNALAQASPWRKVPVLRGLVNFAAFLAGLWPACRRCDCIHVFSHSHLAFFLFTFPAVAAGRLLGRRIVVHYHGGAAEAFLARWYWLARWALSRADVVVVPSGFLGAVFERFGIATVEVPNILDLTRFPFRGREPLRPRVIVTRHLEPHYNVGCAVRAFAELHSRYPEASMVVAGDGSDRPAVEALARRLGVGACVSFAGNVPNERIGQLYDEADIYLNTSRIDNQPVSILEAFACGLPVVSTAVGGIPHMVTHGEDALLAPDDDAAELARHMAALLSDNSLARRLAETGRARVARYSWPSVYGRHKALYGGESAR